MSKKSPEDRVAALESRTAMYGPINIGGPCVKCGGGQAEHVGLTCKQLKARKVAEMRKVFQNLKCYRCGKPYRITLMGGHVCETC